MAINSEISVLLAETGGNMSKSKNKPKAPLFQREMTKKEHYALLHLMAAVSEYHYNSGELSNRAKQAGIWDAMTVAANALTQCLKKLIETMPAKAKSHLIANLDNIRTTIEIVDNEENIPGKLLPAKKHPDYVCLPANPVNMMIRYLVDNECFMCEKKGQDAVDCPYRNAITSLYAYQVENVQKGECVYSGWYIDE